MSLASPSSPSGITEISADTASTYLQLSWSAPNGDVALSGYNVYRYDNGSNIPILVGTVPASTTTFTDANLFSDTSYSYRIQAINADGVTSSLSSAATLSTSTVIPTDVFASTSVTGTSGTSVPVVVVWDPIPDVYFYTISERITRPNHLTSVSNITLYPDDPTVPPYWNFNGIAGYTYSFTITATNGMGQSTSAGTVLALQNITSLPATPQGFTGTYSNSTTLNLAWADPSNTGSTEYQVQETSDTTTPSSWAPVGSLTSSLTETLTIPTGTTPLYYRVLAYNSSSSLYSDPSNIIFPTSSDQNQTVMLSTLLGNATSPSVEIDWTLWPSAYEYDVYRRLAGTSDWGSPETMDGTNEGWLDDKPVQPGAKYEYKVVRKSFDSDSPATPMIGVGYITTGIEVGNPEGPVNLVSNITLGTFKDNSGGSGPYSVLVKWDNGNITAGSVVASTDGSGQYQIVGVHGYSAQGTYSFTATVTELGNVIAEFTGDIYADEVPTVVASSNAVEGAAYDVSLQSPAPVYQWWIDWGDGTSGSPDVETHSNNPDLISHNYMTTGTKTVTVKTVNQDGTSFTVKSFSVTVGAGAVTNIIDLPNTGASVVNGIDTAWSDNNATATVVTPPVINDVTGAANDSTSSWVLITSNLTQPILRGSLDLSNFLSSSISLTMSVMSTYQDIEFDYTNQAHGFVHANITVSGVNTTSWTSFSPLTDSAGTDSAGMFDGG